ncbi:hypothetical protein LXL04_017043 [Taraxacum kok-saghyz]
MNSMRNHCFLFFVLSSFCYLLPVTYGTEWNVTITNGIQDDAIDVHIKSTDHDLGTHNIPANMAYSWTFFEKIIGTKFTGDFSEASRFQSLALVDREIMNHCRNHEVNNVGKLCFWLVKPDGFYLSSTNAPFPNDWVKKKSCSFCYLLPVTYGTEWNVTITNGIQDDAIDVHIKSTDHDLGTHNIPANMAYSWTFFEKIIGTKFTGDFSEGSRFQSLALVDREIMDHCRNHEVNNVGKLCFWLVKPDGFYLSSTNASFPNDWVKKKSW